VRRIRRESDIVIESGLETVTESGSWTKKSGAKNEGLISSLQGDLFLMMTQPLVLLIRAVNAMFLTL